MKIRKLLHEREINNLFTTRPSPNKSKRYYISTPTLVHQIHQIHRNLGIKLKFEFNETVFPGKNKFKVWGTIFTREENLYLCTRPKYISKKIRHPS